jgi:hypothetical protein
MASVPISRTVDNNAFSFRDLLEFLPFEVWFWTAVELDGLQDGGVIWLCAEYRLGIRNPD